MLGLPLAGTVAHGQTVTGDVTIVSDFRYRGVSLSDGRPAFQADATLLFATGFYGNLWTSTIAPYNGARQEVDLTAGRRFSFDGVAIDASVVAYTYPAAPSRSYVEVPVSASRTVGPWTWGGGAAYAPAQAGTNGRANTYIFVQSAWRPSGSPLSFTTSVGRENGGFADDKIDWSLSASGAMNHASFSFSYIGYEEGRTRQTVVASLIESF